MYSHWLMLRFSSIFYYYYYFFLQRLCVSLKRQRERESPCHQLLKNCGGADLLSFPLTHTLNSSRVSSSFLSDENAKISDLYRRTCVFFIALLPRAVQRGEEEEETCLRTSFFLSFFGWGCLSLVNRIPFSPTTVSAQALCRELVVKRSLERGYIFSFYCFLFFFFDIYYITFICCVWLYSPLCWLSCDGLRVYFPSRFGNGGPGLLSTAD